MTTKEQREELRKAIADHKRWPGDLSAWQRYSRLKEELCAALLDDADRLGACEAALQRIALHTNEPDTCDTALNALAQAALEAKGEGT